MERRSFFSTVAGFLFGATRAAAKPLPPAPVPDPEEEIDFGSPPPPTHRDPVAMFADIRRFVDAHPGAVVLSADFPQFLRLGFSIFTEPPEGYCSEKSALFTIPIVCMLGFSGRESDLLRSAAGRRALAADLMKGTV